MATKSQTPEEVASRLQELVISHLEEIYVRRASSATRWISADEDLRWTLELVCEQLPIAIQPCITKILALRSQLHGIVLDRYYV